MKVLLLSAYNTHSHKYWAELMVDKLVDYDWTFLALPARKFFWRIRGNALSWYVKEHNVLKKNYDVVFATSMVDLATLVGLFPHLGKAKKILYFHENQFEYPLSDNMNKMTIDPMMVNLYGALCADKVLFNSQYNRDSFLSGAAKFLKKIDDNSPVSVLEGIKTKSSLLPVPICEKQDRGQQVIKNSIIWNHRWEYDKNPEDFYQALKILKDKNIDFKLIVMGIQFKKSPEVFLTIKEEFAGHILCWGQQTKEDYLQWLKKGEFVVSTAIHEFQGLAIMEAVQMGAIPVVPNRLSYPQWFSNDYLYANTPQELADHLEKCFKTQMPIPDLSSLIWESLKDSYAELF